MHALTVTDEGRLDVLARESHYRSIRLHLADQFLADLDAVYGTLARNPLVYGEVHNDVRAAMVGRFQDVVYYRVKEGGITVFAVMHGHRHPNAWKRRVKNL
jgi:toxin ParE1/3/4